MKSGDIGPCTRLTCGTRSRDPLSGELWTVDMGSEILYCEGVRIELRAPERMSGTM